MRSSLKLIAAGSLLAFAQLASADCTVATVKGVWGFDYEITDLPGQQNCVGIGFMTFSSGTLSNNTIKITAQRNSCNGAAEKTFSATGTYSITAACTGKSTNLKYTSSDPGSTLDFNIVQSGTKLQFILVQSNHLTMRGDAVKR